MIGGTRSTGRVLRVPRDRRIRLHCEYTRHAGRFRPVHRRVVLSILVSAIALGARPARAGLDCDNDTNMRLVEAFAKDRSKPPRDDSYAWFCLEGGTEKLRARIEKACLEIVDRDGENSPCMRVAAGAGIGKLGGHDVFAFVASMPEDPLNSEAGSWPKLSFLSRLGDPRGAAVIVDMWKAALVRADKLEKANRHYFATEWSSWRQFAASVLGGLGGADDQAFLLAQASATKDRYVAQACRDAAAAIGKRLARDPHSP